MTEPWYLAHPVRTDERFTEEQNLEHTKKVQRILMNAAEIMTVTPWFSWILIHPSWRNEEVVEQFLIMDEKVVEKLGRIVLSGHRLSSGMERELRALPQRGQVMNFIGVPDDILFSVARRTVL